jgi:hypothetical protein
MHMALHFLELDIERWLLLGAIDKILKTFYNTYYSGKQKNISI